MGIFHCTRAPALESASRLRQMATRMVVYSRISRDRDQSLSIIARIESLCLVNLARLLEKIGKQTRKNWWSQSQGRAHGSIELYPINCRHRQFQPHRSGERSYRTTLSSDL
jgi:hypothetical protein